MRNIQKLPEQPARFTLAFSRHQSHLGFVLVTILLCIGVAVGCIVCVALFFDHMINEAVGSELVVMIGIVILFLTGGVAMPFLFSDRLAKRAEKIGLALIARMRRS